MYNPFLAESRASCRITGADGVALFARGCATARTGAGVYTVTLDRGADANECIVLAQSETISTFASVAHTSDTVKTISVENDASAATDSNVGFILFVVVGGTGR